jgi:hypothetical protein
MAPGAGNACRWAALLSPISEQRFDRGLPFGILQTIDGLFFFAITLMMGRLGAGRSQPIKSS